MLRKFLIFFLAFGCFIYTNAQDSAAKGNLTITSSVDAYYKSNFQNAKESPIVFAKSDSSKTDTLPMPTPMPPSAMAGASPMTTPGMAGPLQANPRPFGYNFGHFGTIYVTGVVSGIGKLQNNVFTGEKKSIVDLSNGQVFIQKVDGVFQFFV